MRLVLDNSGPIKFNELNGHYTSALHLAVLALSQGCRAKRWLPGAPGAIDAPAKTKVIEIPAECKSVRWTVLANAATTREVTIPAEFETITVRKLVEAAAERLHPGGISNG